MGGPWYALIPSQPAGMVTTMSVEVVGTSNGALHVALEPTLLDEVHEKFSCGQIDDGMNALLPGLKARRLACGVVHRFWCGPRHRCVGGRGSLRDHPPARALTGRVRRVQGRQP